MPNNRMFMKLSPNWSPPSNGTAPNNNNNPTGSGGKSDATQSSSSEQSKLGGGIEDNLTGMECFYLSYPDLFCRLFLPFFPASGLLLV
jgi:hypothetical protein